MNISSRTNHAEVSTQTKRVFRRLASVYGDKFRRHFRSEKGRQFVEREWDDVLSVLSDTQVNRAITATKFLSNWDPNAAEFIRLACNLPDLETCQGRVISSDLVDRVSYMVYEKIGAATIQAADTTLILKLVKCHYQDCYAKALTEQCGKPDWVAPTALADDAAAVAPGDRELYQQLKLRVQQLNAKGINYTINPSADLVSVTEEVEQLEWHVSMQGYANG